MSTFDDDERSIDASRPIDLYTIATTTRIYRLTSHVVDVAFGDDTYEAATVSRNNLQLAQDLTGRELIISLPIDHPIVQRYVSSGIPDQSVLVTLHRLQQRSGVAVPQWQGFGGGMSIRGAVADLRVPALTDDAMRVQLPVLQASKDCPHQLFDERCAPSPGLPDFDGPVMTDFGILTAVIDQVDDILTVLDMRNVPDRWANSGYVEMPNGTRREVVDQVGTRIQLHMPFDVADLGLLVFIFAGCDKSAVMCRAKFNNIANFGGFPFLNAGIDPWAPKGLGVIQQI